MLTKEFTAGIIEDAVESGIGYWAQIDSYHWTDPELRKGDTEYSVMAHITEIGDGDSGTKYVINHSIIKRAFRRLIKDVPGLHPQIRARIYSQSLVESRDAEIDAGDADILVQIGLFGEVKYG